MVKSAISCKYAAYVRKIRNVYRILGRESKDKRSLGRPGHRLENYVKDDHEAREWNGVEWGGLSDLGWSPMTIWLP
jgi:hypothetical protein